MSVTTFDKSDKEITPNLSLVLLQDGRWEYKYKTYEPMSGDPLYHYVDPYKALETVADTLADQSKCLANQCQVIDEDYKKIKALQKELDCARSVYADWVPGSKLKAAEAEIETHQQSNVVLRQEIERLTQALHFAYEPGKKQLYKFGPEGEQRETYSYDEFKGWVNAEILRLNQMLDILMVETEALEADFGAAADAAEHWKDKYNEAVNGKTFEQVQSEHDDYQRKTAKTILDLSDEVALWQDRCKMHADWKSEIFAEANKIIDVSKKQSEEIENLKGEIALLKAERDSKAWPYGKPLTFVTYNPDPHTMPDFRYNYTYVVDDPSNPRCTW